MTLGLCARESLALHDVVVDDKDRPVSGAKVYVHTSRGTIFDRNQHIWVRTSKSDGSYLRNAKYRHEETYACAPGFYPNFADKTGRIRLRRIPAETLPILEGSVVVRTDGTVLGFDFASGRHVSVDKADIIPVGADFESSSLELAARGAGGFARIDSDRKQKDRRRVRSMCLFLSATQPPIAQFESTGGTRTTGPPLSRGPWFVRCRDGQHFAKLITSYVSLSPDASELELTFHYVFQPKTGAELGAKWNLKRFEKLLPAGSWHSEK